MFRWSLKYVQYLFTQGRLWPVWIHFQAWREDEENPQVEHPLSIRRISASISESYLLIKTRETEPRVDFNVAADPGKCSHSRRPLSTQIKRVRIVGTHAATSGDVIGHINLRNEFTWSQTNIDAVKSWIRRCSSDHPSCRTTMSACESTHAEEAPLPTRCLEIWPILPSIDNPQGLGCVLRETKNLFGRYIALSHRWERRTQRARTLKYNYCCQTSKCNGSHTCHGIELTETFMRACVLAVKLGVRFVWIDSLCIIQDDVEDWNRESIQMGNYYQRAWLTIFVAIPSPTESSTTQPLSAEPSTGASTETAPFITRLPYRGKDSRQHGFFYLQCTGAAAVTKDYMQDINGSELLMRGWVCQEWFLSRRRLALSPTGAYLQCSTGPPQTISGEVVRAPKNAGTNVMASLDMNSHESILASWNTVVEYYSRLLLSFIVKDRFCALLGIANEFSKALHKSQSFFAYHFVSGLWFGDLTPWIDEVMKSEFIGVNHSILDQLPHRAWVVDTTSFLWLQGVPRSRIKGIPTWSWASMATLTEGGTIAGMPVVWGWHSRMQVALGRRFFPLAISSATSTVCTLENVIAVPVNEDSWEPIFHQAAEFRPDDKYASVQRFSILGILGSLIPVTIHGQFQSLDDISLAASITMQTEDSGRSMWRCATLTAKPDIIRGWASLEHPDFQDGVARVGVHTLLALVIEKTTAQGGLAFGNWFHNTCPAYRVLFVGEVRVPGYSNTYERIGAGVFFGYEFQQEYERAEERKIWLV